MATTERLAAMAASRCARCTGQMVVTRVEAGADKLSELRTYACAECGYSRTYSVDAGDS
jgi:DNA-directed RNA polymerase subunit RPC12/RpoP